MPNYLEPIRAAFGEHQGLNADWNSMAWNIRGDSENGLWILDDESSEETVSLVASATLSSGDKAIIEIASGSVETVLRVAKAILEA